jgi:NAD(P)-dependent dehydrogenase (short-subunit alcohol dehydrogenase family)
MKSVSKLFDLDGKTALVPGSSRGPGLKIAQALGEQGARTVVNYRLTQVPSALEAMRSRLVTGKTCDPAATT